MGLRWTSSDMTSAQAFVARIVIFDQGPARWTRCPYANRSSGRNMRVERPLVKVGKEILGVPVVHSLKADGV